MHMNERETLHRLVDTLPEGALEPAKRTLEHLQVWPPQPPPEVERMRREMGAQGFRGGCVGSGSYFLDPDRKMKGGSMSSSHAEPDGTLIFQTRRFLQGHEVRIEERMRVPEGAGKLVYSHDIVGPDGQESREEMEFALPV